jgi:hypothetical protein
MSNSLAIAAVTMTLQNILQTAFDSETALNAPVTLLPLDKARVSSKGNQLNLFLYMMTRNAAWANGDMPRQVKPGERAISPLPLNLYYLITAFGSEDDSAQAASHEVMGKAMSVLYDHPVLSAKDIVNATALTLPGNDLAQQIEPVRVTPHPLPLDELSKLWTGFAMQYRLSAAYEVGVTLIESTRAAKTPLPVLTRGPKDRGIPAQGDLTPPLPTLYSVSPPNQQPAARPGEVLTFTGIHLDGATGVRFTHRLWNAPVELVPQTTSATSITVKLPDPPNAWPAGFYTVEIVVQRNGETFTRTTNQLTALAAPSFSLFVTAPSIAPSAPPGALDITLSVAPDVLAPQRATLMLGDRELVRDVPPSTDPPSSTLTFSAVVVPPGTYLARLRVDGVDSLLIDRSQPPPVFYSSQMVNV